MSMSRHSHLLFIAYSSVFRFSNSKATLLFKLRTLAAHFLSLSAVAAYSCCADGLWKNAIGIFLTLSPLFSVALAILATALL